MGSPTHQFQTLLKPHQIIRCVDHSQTEVSEPIEKTPDQIASLEDWEEFCKNDKFCQEIRTAITDPKVSRNDIELANCTISKYSFCHNEKEYVPEALRETLLRQLHENPLYGHRGSAALYSLLIRRYWWPDCHRDCKKYARGCEACQRNNPSVQKPQGFLKPLPAPEAAFRHLTLDFIGPLPTCKVRDYYYRFILQVVDRLTKRVWIIAVERPTAIETAEAFLNNIVRFAGKLSTSYHPQTDGQTERANKILEVYLRNYVNHYQDNWVKYLPLAEFCCNNHVNSSTGVTPFFATFGHHPRLDFRPESESPAPRNTPEFVERIKSIIKHCSEQITLAQAFQSDYANEKRLPAPRYQVGDYVYLSLKKL